MTLLAAGCSAPPAPAAGDGLVLLAHRHPGMAMSPEMFDPPDFVLYGDGLAIARDTDDRGVVRLTEYHLTPQRVNALFADADDADLFDDEDYRLDEQIADGGVLVVELRTAGTTHVVQVPAPSSDDFGARGEAAEFAESLAPHTWPAGDFTEPPAPYRPATVAVTYSIDPTLDTPASPWPLPAPTADGCVLLTGPAATLAQETGETTGRMTAWRHGDTTFHAWVRPLLPDETDCADTTIRHTL